MKKILIIILSGFIAFSPLLTLGNFSFAEDEEPSFITVDDEYAFTAAMKAYAKVNYNLTTLFSYGEYNDPINSFIAGWSYNQYRRICNTLGIDLTTLQQSIQYRVDSNGALQFLYNGSFIQNYNAVIRQYMLDHNIDPDAFNQNQRVYSGLTFKDSNTPSHSCLVFIMKDNTLHAWSDTADTHIDQFGTAYRYDGAEARRHILNGSSFDISINVNNGSYTMYFSNYIGNDYIGTRYYPRQQANQDKSIYLEARTDTHPDWNITTIAGYPSVFKLPNGRYYFGNYLLYSFNNGTNTSLQTQYYCSQEIDTNVSNNLIQTLIDIAKAGAPQITSQPDHNALIDVGKMGADNAVNALKKYIEDEEPEEEPKIDPDYQGGTPNYPKPQGRSWPTGIHMDPEGDFNFVMPDLDLDWNLDLSLTNLPFPFSIPYDIYRFLSILDATPEAPRYEIHTEVFNTPIDLEIDLSVFDQGMVIIRGIILAGYCIFLIIATRDLFHIY